MRRATATVFGIALFGIALSGACGVEPEEQPRVLAPELVPYELLNPTTTTTAPPAAGVPATLYLVHANDRLTPVQREVRAPVTVQQLLTSLLEPLTQAELDAGLRSSIPNGTHLIEVSTVEDGLVTVDLSRHLFDVSGDTLRRAIAQVVWTATAANSPEVTRVKITVEGVDQGLPGGKSGETVEGPVRRSDYGSLAPPPGATLFVPPTDQQG